MLGLLRTNAVTIWEPEPRDFSPSQPNAINPPTTPPQTSTPEERHDSAGARVAVPPPPIQFTQERGALGPPPIIETSNYPLAQDSTETATTNRSSPREGTAPPTTALIDQEGEPGPMNREAALAILGMDNILLWDPAEELLSPTLLAGLATPPSIPPLPVTEGQYFSLEGGTANKRYPADTAQPAPASTPPPAGAPKEQHSGTEEEEVELLLQECAATPEEILAPPTTTLQSLTNAQPFVPGKPWTSARTQRMDLSEQTVRREGAPNTSPIPTPPSSPQHAVPLAPTSVRQQHCMRAGTATSQPQPSSPTVTETTHLTPPSSPGPLLPPSRATGSLARISIDPERMDETLRQPFYQELTPFTGRRLGNFEWVAFEEVLSRWSTAITKVVRAQHQRPRNPTSQWARRRRRREQDGSPEVRPNTPPATTDSPPHPSQPTDTQDPTAPSNNRASGWARRAAKSKRLQRLYRVNPGACMRHLLDNTPPVHCAIPESDQVAHFSTTFAAPPPLGPPPTWLFPDRHPGDPGVPGATDEGDVLQTPVTPEEVVTQFKRVKRTAPGIDGITYANWRWVDPQGLILSTIFNICGINCRVPRKWKHSVVTLIHKGGDTA